ncbi:hypothetical protein GQ42DRAFT_163256, partial [Ramicandelaber brevisporus]
MSVGSKKTVTSAQFTAVCPYLTGLPYGGIINDGILCFDEHNRRLFGMHGVSNIQLMCPLLKRIHLNVCCGSSNIYDYKDIIPANFPQLRSLSVSVHVCTNHIEGNGDTALQKLLSQHWPSVTDMGLHGALNSSAVDAAFLYNSQLTSIYLEIGPGMADESGVFLIERVLAPLPALSSITLRCDDDIKLDSQWTDSNNWESARFSELLDLAIESTTIASQILGLLMMLPKLVRVHLY